MMVWRNSVIWGVLDRTVAGSAGALPAWVVVLLLALVLVDDRRRGRHVLRQHDLRLAVLPLADEELALRAAVLVPAELPEDRVDLVGADPVRELQLVVYAADALDSRLEHLRRRVGVGRVL